MGNYHPILMKFHTQTNKIMLSSKVTKVEVTTAFKMAAAAMLEIQVLAMKWAITTGL
jgi:hypothetical protein